MKKDKDREGVDREFHREESFAHEGELTRIRGENLPRALDPVMTMEVVRRYVETERLRTRKILIWTSSIFLFLVFLVLALFISVGIFVLGHTRRTTEMVDDLQAQTALYASEVVGVTNRMGRVEQTQTAIGDGLVRTEAERVRESRIFKSNLERFGRWVSTKDSHALDEFEQRLVEIDARAAQREAELMAQLAAVKSDYSNLVVEVVVAAAQGASDAPLDDAKIETSGMAVTAASIEEELLPDDVVAAATSGFAEAPASRPAPTPAPVEVDAAALIKREQDARPTTVTFPNGDRYEGELENGLFQGWGAYYYHNGDRYEGQFRNDVKNGRGTFFYRNGDEYGGEFKNDVKDGQGKFLFANGDMYVGEFRNDTMNGKGTLTYSDGNTYSGEFKNGLKDSTGVFTFENGDVYKGEFQDDQRNGRGTYFFRDGAKYIGEFKDGKRHGSGRYVYAGGEEYVGEFRNGMKHGRGVSVYPNGERIEGIWENDKFISRPPVAPESAPAEG